MFSGFREREYSLTSALIVVCLGFACITIDLSSMICAQPTASVSSFSPDSSIVKGSKTPVELSFQQFINSNSHESTVVGELNPNASASEQMLTQNKIADLISAMQEMDSKAKKSAPDSVSEHPSQADCYIEITRVDKVAGKCHKASSGLPICQSEDYMTISNECS